MGSRRETVITVIFSDLSVFLLEFKYYLPTKRPYIITLEMTELPLRGIDMKNDLISYNKNNYLSESRFDSFHLNSGMDTQVLEHKHWMA